MYRTFVTADSKEEPVEELSSRELLRKQGLDWDDSEPLGPMELTGAYYVRGHNDGFAQGFAQGFKQGLAQGRAGGREQGRAALASAIEGVCELLLDITFGPSERAQVQALDTDGLDALHAQLVKTRRWPVPR